MSRSPGAAVLLVVISLLGPTLAGGEGPQEKSLHQRRFGQLLSKYENLTYDGLHAKAYQKKNYTNGISFNPAQAKYFQAVKKGLGLQAQELAILQQNGFVSLDLNRRYSFGSAYYQIYTKDLPVLVTTDSILHAVHRAYDTMLMELEVGLFTPVLAELLEDCHEALAREAAGNRHPVLAENYQDVDLYLSVARNLLRGAGATDNERKGGALGRLIETKRPGAVPPPSGLRPLYIRSKLDQNGELQTRLRDIRSRVLQYAFRTPPTKIYGGERYVDYSQFTPRGHYTKTRALSNYFQAMAWLGRADCGFFVLPTDHIPGVAADSERELRNAALLTRLLQSSGGVKRLKGVDAIINFLVGGSDNLTVFATADLLKENGIDAFAALAEKPALNKLQQAIREGKHAEQLIRSQIIYSHPGDEYKVPPPALFQMFGQRFIVDSFVLSQVVFDSIIFENQKQLRMMPRGLDVMAALGNDEALLLLEPDLRKWNYSANLLACREFVGQYKPAFWTDNLYNIWLDCFRALDDDLGKNSVHFPQAMRSRAWQMKQLQTQLASWAELRHDTMLYAKQSYTGGPLCEYPAGYVEPYPAFYAKVKRFAGEAHRRIAAADYTSRDENRAKTLKHLKQRHLKFFEQMQTTLGRLETLANKQLEAAPFTKEEQTFLKKTIDRRGGGSGPPRYDGWYCDLLYGGKPEKWDPTIADVHTDPESERALQVGVGDVNFCVIAIDNDGDRAVYVGPIFSYYEFSHPAKNRLTDPKWQLMIGRGKLPPRPQWTSGFQAPARRMAEESVEER